MSVSISGILLDPFGQPASFAEVKFITWQGANDVLTTAPAVFKTSADGAYSFAVEFATYTVQVRYNQSNGKFQTIKQKVIVNSNVTATTLGELLLFNEPLTPPEIAYVEQLVAEAEGYRDEAEVFAQASEASSQASEGFSQASSGYADDANQSAIDAANSAALIAPIPLNGGVWASGQTYDFYNQYMIYNGEAYSPLPATTLPYTVGAVPDLGFVYQIKLNDHSLLANKNNAGQHDGIFSRSFKTVADLKAGVSADGTVITMSDIVGAKVHWRGYYSESDGGSNWGIVKSGINTGDDFSIFSIDANTYVEANQTTNSVNFKKGGAKGDDLFVNDDAFKTVLDYANTNKIPKAVLGSGLFRTDTTTTLPSGVTLRSYNQSGVKFLTGSGVYFSQIRYYGDGPAILMVRDGVNSVSSYSTAAVNGVQLKYYGTTQDTAFGIQIGTLAEESLQTVVKNTLIQNFGRGIYNIGSWNCQLTDVYIYSTVNPVESEPAMTFGVYTDCEIRAITSNYYTRVFVQSCDIGFYIQGAASYSGMTDVYTDACNIGYFFNGANVSPGRGWSIKGMGLEAPKYRGLIVNSTTVDITGFSFVKGVSTTYERIVQVENDGSCHITGGDDIPSASYGTVDGMNVDGNSDLVIRDIVCAPQNMIKGDGAITVDIKDQQAYGRLIRWPALNETIGFGNRNNQRSGYASYVWLPDGSTQSVPTTTGLVIPTFDVSLVSVGDRITVTNIALAGSGYNLNLKDESQTGFAQTGIIKHEDDATGIIIAPGDIVTLIKLSDGKLHRIKDL